MNRALRWAVVIGSIASVGCAGCGGSVLPAADASRTEAKVRGTVKIRGKAMTEGEVRFDPTSAARIDVGSRTAKVKSDGTYEITTFIGHNAVRVSGPALKKEPTLEYVTKVVEVSSGENKIDLDIPSN